MTNPDVRADVGVIGMAVMGSNLALNLTDHGFRVALWNRTPGVVDQLVAEHPQAALVPAHDLGEFVRHLERPRRILLMVQAGAPVDGVIDLLQPLLEAGDILADCGNSWFVDTERRQRRLERAGLHFVGVGISGGQRGARLGPSVMPGGPVAAYERLVPLFERVAARTEHGPCFTHVGPGGSGHFVKMVHNGIEYADMQLLAEAYDLMKRALGYDAARMASVFARWNEGPLGSFLVELTARVLAVVDPDTKQPLVELVLDQAGQKGTGRWTVAAATELGVPVSTIAAAVDARVLSAMYDERQLAARCIPTPAILAGAPSGGRGLEDAIHDALLASKVVAYAQGMALIRAASKAHAWNVDLAEVARIWTGGCILRARLLVPIMAAYQREPDLANLLLDPSFEAYAHHTQPGWRDTLGAAYRHGIPTPALAAGLAYYDAYRSARLPQNLIQAQRDAFGAHLYRRIDHPGSAAVHTDWLGDDRKG